MVSGIGPQDNGLGAALRRIGRETEIVAREAATGLRADRERDPALYVRYLSSLSTAAQRRADAGRARGLLGSAQATGQAAEEARSVLVELRDFGSRLTAATAGEATQFNALAQRYNDAISAAAVDGANVLTAATTASVLTLRRGNELAGLTGQGLDAANTVISPVVAAAAAGNDLSTRNYQRAVNMLQAAVLDIGGFSARLTAFAEIDDGIADIVEGGARDSIAADINSARLRLEQLTVQRDIANATIGVLSANYRSVLRLFGG